METFNLNDLSNLHLNILIYGEPGSGKTRFVGSMGECLYTLAVDVDNGFKTILQLPEAWRKNLVTVKMTSFEDIDKIYKLLLKNDPAELSKALGTEIKKPFQAVAFDTWSSVGWETIQKKRKDVGKLGIGLTFRENIQIQDWGAIQDFHRLCMEAFTDLPVSCVITMHEMMYEDEKAGFVKGVPSINGRLAPEIGKYFDVQGHMVVDIMGNYVMHTKGHQKFQAKSRLILDAKIADPTFKKIRDAIIK